MAIAKYLSDKELCYPIQQTREYIEATLYVQDYLFYCAVIEDSHPNTDLLKSSKWDSAKEQCLTEVFQCKTDDELKIALQRLDAVLEDSHTNVSMKLNQEDVSFPFGVAWFNNKLHVVCLAKCDSAHWGKEVVAINDISISALLTKTKNLFGGENEPVHQNRLCNTILSCRNRLLFRRLGLPVETADFAITLADGTILEAKPEETCYERSLEHPVTKRKNASYKTWYNHKVAYLQLNSMTKPLEKAAKEFDNFFDSVRQKQLQTVVIDLRHNDGGSSLIGDMLLQRIAHKPITNRHSVHIGVSRLSKLLYPNILPYLQNTRQVGEVLADYDIPEEEKFSGQVYFFQGVGSYSSAEMLLSLVHDGGLYPTVGEPSRQKSCSYGDILSFRLPNTGIAAGVSFKYFIRPDAALCPEDYLYPSVYIPYTLEDYKAGNDPCWSWVLKQAEK
ncbi:MAG: S41 family peptidase [Prevotellaceae bacterium]|jgi:hypothetical protein|nr:S41 family peptidase [Prevotellaceae bacterium]